MHLSLQTVVDVAKVGHLVLLKYDDFCESRADVECTLHAVNKVLPFMTRSTTQRKQYIEHLHL